MKKVLFILLAVTMLSCQSRVNPGEWVVSTATCWNTMTVSKAGNLIPRLITTCDRIVILPATELAAEFKTETKFAQRVAGTIEITYQWRITNPIEFINSAKSITSSATSEGHKIDPNALEAIENAIVDKLLINLVREYTPTVAPTDIDELKIEKHLQELAKEGFTDRGVEFNNLSVNVNLSPQAEEALDVISALNFYKENGQEELGRKIIEAKAGATKIVINQHLEKQTQE